MREQTFLVRLTGELPQFEEVETLAAHALTQLRGQLAADGCALVEFYAPGRYALHRDEASGPVSGHALPAFAPDVMQRFAAGEPVLTVQAAPFGLLGWHSGAVAGMPLANESGCRAVLCALRAPGAAARARAFGAHDLQLMAALLELLGGWLARLRAQRALRESEAQYRRLVESSRDGVWEVDDSGHTRFVNARMAQLLGYDVAEMIGQPMERFVAVEQRERLADNFERRRAGIGESIDYGLRRKDGSPLWARMEINPMTDHAGRFSGALGMVSDATERRRAEADQQFLVDLAEQLTRANDVAAAKRVLVSSIGAQLAADRCIFVDFVVSRERAIVAEEWQRTPSKSLIGSHRIAPLETVVNELTAGRSVLVNDAQRDPRSLEVYATLYAPLQLRSLLAVPILTDGRLIGCLGVFCHTPRAWIARDAVLVHSALVRTALCIDRLETIAVLRSFNRDLERRVTARTSELQAALREKEILIKEIHHRVKNNLQVISSMLNLQAMNMPDDATRAVFAESQSRVQSIALVHEALYQSKDLSRVNFVAYARMLVDTIFHALCAPGRGIARRVEASDVRLPVAAAIPCGLIINELVTNALKHAFPSPRSGTVSVSIRRDDGGQVELRVADDGIGLPIEDASRAQTLGLDLVFTLAEQLGATVEVERVRGTAFRFAFDDRV